MNFTAITVFGIAFIFLTTVLGAALVYCFKKEIPKKLQSVIFGFAAGVMTAASVWSLLLPALEESEKVWGRCAFIPVSIGFLLGGALIVVFERVYTFSKAPNGEWGDTPASVRARKLFFSMTLHNIPEGLAVGFAFGAAHLAGTAAAYIAALGLAVGIGCQNLPEGAAVSLPMKTALNSKNKAFVFGVGSALAEPIFAIIGYFFVSYLRVLQPWLLAFSAGAMIFVVAEELLPETKCDGGSIGAWGVMVGFVLMMVLDVAL